jgi:hypothetical protein
VHTALPSTLLVAELEAADFAGVRFFGGHDGSTFDPATTESVIVVATRT